MTIKYDQVAVSGESVIAPDGRIGKIVMNTETCYIIGFWKEDGLYEILDTVGIYEAKDCKILYNLCDKLKGLKGTTLYSPVCGQVVVCNINDGKIEVTPNIDQEITQVLIFDRYGRLYENGEVMLYPSREQQTWDNWEKPTIRKPNQTYWFVSSKFNICEKVDLGQHQDTRHFETGNYYSTKEKAQLAKERVIKTFKSIEY